MARNLGPVCRLCRREGLKLFLKGERCYTDKCAIERRNYPPGAHGQSRTRFSEFSIRLREKQKVKRIYRMLEKQFAGYFASAERMPGITGENLLVLLERRLDNVVYRLGFASSASQARQLVRHGHIEINGKVVTIPSYIVAVNQVVSITEKSRQKKVIVEAIELSQRRGLPAWIALEREQFRGSLKALPTRGDLTMPISEKLIVEHYSR
ncbi:MAG TPA: 30S ribosomal protein S4 [Candidatus Binataceae bacterium]|nr:30S ribosomal protein S4 [Candidatus Binataceae bacterium]HVB80059.1 30S ribosomal protein S4 [Candidatus Binataceae bacterium]